MLNDKAHHQIKFKFDHPEHGPVEGQGTIPKSVENPKHSDVTLHTMGLEGDMHVTPEDLSEGDHALGIKHALKTHLDSKLGKSEDMEKCGSMSKSEINYTRKPTSKEDVADEVEHDHPHLKNLPELHHKDIAKNPEHFLSEFKENTPAKFKMKHGDDTYAVNTEGYNYPRYVSKIKKQDSMKKSEISEFGSLMAKDEVTARLTDGIDFSKEEFSVEEVGQMVLAKGYSLSKGSYNGMSVKENISKSAKERLTMMKAKVDEGLSIAEKQKSRGARQERYHPDGYSSERNMPPAPHPDTIGNEEEYNEYIDPKRRDKFGADLQRVKAKEQMGKLPVGTTKEMTSRGEHGNVRGHVQENSGHYADPENIRTGVGMHPSRKSRPGTDKKQEPMRSGKEGGFYSRQGQARRQEVLQSAGPGEFDRETRSFPYDQAPERTPQQARAQRIKEVQDRSQARVANERNIASSRVLPKSESMMKARVDENKDLEGKVRARQERNDRTISSTKTPTGQNTRTAKTGYKRKKELEVGSAEYDKPNQEGQFQRVRGIPAERRKGEKIVGTPKENTEENSGVHERGGSYAKQKNVVGGGPRSIAANSEKGGEKSWSTGGKYHSNGTIGSRFANRDVMEGQKKIKPNLPK